VGTADADVDIAKLRAKLAPVTPPPSPLCAREELAALQALYAATGGRTLWRSRRGWSIFDSSLPVTNATTDPCRVDWDGVMCLNGHVVALYGLVLALSCRDRVRCVDVAHWYTYRDLSSMGLQGNLPDELMHLPFLKTLYGGLCDGSMPC
jgi:hypothetical protein